jgi:hypothetical protein
MLAISFLIKTDTVLHRVQHLAAADNTRTKLTPVFNMLATVRAGSSSMTTKIRERSLLIDVRETVKCKNQHRIKPLRYEEISENIELLRSGDVVGLSQTLNFVGNVELEYVWRFLAKEYYLPPDSVVARRRSSVSS